MGAEAWLPVLPGLQRLKSRGTGFLLEKWENAGCPSASTTAAGSGSGDGLGNLHLHQAPQVTPLWTEEPTGGQFQADHAGSQLTAALCVGSPPCPETSLGSCRPQDQDRPRFLSALSPIVASQPSAPFCTASGPGPAPPSAPVHGLFLPLD